MAERQDAVGLIKWRALLLDIELFHTKKRSLIIFYIFSADGQEVELWPAAASLLCHICGFSFLEELSLAPLKQVCCLICCFLWKGSYKR